MFLSYRKFSCTYIINDINEHEAYDQEFDELPDFAPRIGPATLERIVCTKGF
jgi:hypothetical protein